MRNAISSLRTAFTFVVLWSVLSAPVGARGAAETFKVPMRDGTRLATDVYRPEGEGPWPAILARGPYGRGGLAAAAIGVACTQKGYVFVSQDMRGRGDSEGHHAVIFGNDGWGERQDGYDTVEWVAQQAWSNGKVGTWGMSALGITQVMMAPSQPPHLVCQHISVAFGSMYHDTAYIGGAWGASLLPGWLESTKMTEVNLDTFLKHPRYDEFWQGFDAVTVADRVNVPILCFGGWYDCFCQGTINFFTAVQERGGTGARGKCRLIMGPYAHGQMKELKYPKNSGFPKESDQFRWFDHWLKGKANGVETDKAVMYYVMGDPETKDASGNEWRTADTWPPPSTATPYYFHADRQLSPRKPETSEASLSYESDPKNPVPTVGGANLVIPVGPMDQRKIEDRPDVLVFTTPALTEPVEVTGRIKVKLWISSTARDTDFTAKLCDVYPDGRSMLVTDGIIRCRFRDGFREEHLMEPGTVYAVEIDLWSTSLAFNRGHRIRVHVASSNSPRFEPNPNTGDSLHANDKTEVAKNTIYVDRQHPSHILLPLVPAAKRVPSMPATHP